MHTLARSSMLQNKGLPGQGTRPTSALVPVASLSPNAVPSIAIHRVLRLAGPAISSITFIAHLGRVPVPERDRSPSTLLLHTYKVVAGPRPDGLFFLALPLAATGDSLAGGRWRGRNVSTEVVVCSHRPNSSRAPACCQQISSRKRRGRGPEDALGGMSCLFHQVRVDTFARSGRGGQLVWVMGLRFRIT
ncbi:uncharacterized protein K452DRAFT_86763 [Aplosporella prunicola CBS 121167]|uniref:Uncharacterized protein n=1 Tax=Aplosporella prunicola CBS 121167 TaxID=1176127 RepID=A0A6A6B314_9PEZI|nr:uncharacterized protein K452DRAFT_86763 [Aplosporella prunicola CBS 121167]KAF2138440.1 hypothetical protein K452DRAFT_86763 [Aplosporella prunicola CBS 121167]